MTPKHDEVDEMPVTVGMCRLQHKELLESLERAAGKRVSASRWLSGIVLTVAMSGLGVIGTWVGYVNGSVRANESEIKDARAAGAKHEAVQQAHESEDAANLSRVEATLSRIEKQQISVMIKLGLDPNK